ncbi:MAG: hypothetical protein PHO95_07145 [Bacteroidales bacterium]|nr:hypothetical protein [Bacteroidales bacterium]
MKFRAGVYMIIVGTVILINCSKREIHTTWDNKYKVNVKTTLDTDSSMVGEDISFTTFIYTKDSLIREKMLFWPNDTVKLSSGTYNFITVNLANEGVRLETMERYSSARLIIDSALSNIHTSTINEISIPNRFSNNIDIKLENQVKKIKYQLIIEGERESLEKCIITQHGISKGLYLSTYNQIFDSTSVSSLSAEASNINNYTGSFNLLGLDPDQKDIEVQFFYKNESSQNASLDLSSLQDDYIYSKKIIMYIDIQRVDIEFNAIIKSWVLVDDKIEL